VAGGGFAHIVEPPASVIALAGKHGHEAVKTASYTALAVGILAKIEMFRFHKNIAACWRTM
jgi:hypothetical protein